MTEQADADRADAAEELALDDPQDADSDGEQATDADEQQPTGDDAPAADDDEAEDIVLLGDEAPPASEDEEPAPNWVKELRKQNRELQRKLRDYERGQQPTPQPPAADEPGPEPDLEDFEFDAEAFKAAHRDWVLKSEQAKARKAEAERQQQEAQAAWQQKLQGFAEAKQKLRVPDFDDAEDRVVSTLNQSQQAIIVAYAANPAVVTYALGKRPDKLAELSKIADPIAFAIAASKLEGDLKVQRRTGPKPAPESRVAGGAPVSPGSDKQLERLEKEAARTGDRTKLVAYRKALKAQS